MSRGGDAPAYVRLIDAAVEDLDALLKLDQGILRAVLKKLIQLERDPEQGDPLLGDLIGWRKLTVGDRHWRIVWRPTVDSSGAIELTIAEVWAAGARSDNEVYAEMAERVQHLGDSPQATALVEVIERFGRHAQRNDLQPSHEPAADPVPSWLRERLQHTAKVDPAELDAMTGAEAMDRWERHITGQT